MNDLIIKVSKRSRLIDLDHSTLGIVGENLQEKLIFIFQDEFVDGMARLEYELDGEKRYVLMDKVGQSYILPVQNVLLTKEGNIDLQLVITEDKTGTPVFKSEVFTLFCKKSIEAVGEAPSSYELWIEKANRILLEASRVNIDGKKSGNETTITITQRDGNKKSFPILDGKDGEQGPVGPQGPQGPQGPEGPQGPVGPTPDLSNYVQKPEFNASQAEQDSTIEGLQAELNRYKTLENALPHIQNETPSEYVTLNNTAKSPMEIETIPQTSQDGEPTPYNPQDIHCTTGENLIKVTNSDSTEEATYPISLGTKEMFNINNASDGFVYDEATDKFYFRRWNRKLELPIDDMNNSENYPGWTNQNQIKDDFPDINNALGSVTNYYCNIGTKSGTTIQTNPVTINTTNQSTLMLSKQYFGLTQTEWKTNYSDLIIKLVYNLINYVDEEITDTTLISQLRAIKDALSMQGTTHVISTSSGTNLPFLIKARAVQTIERT